MKAQSRLSPNWCKEQLDSFVQDFVEVVEQLPLILCNAGSIIVAENCKNLQQNRQFQINIERLRIGLSGYQIMTICILTHICQSEI